MKRLHTTQRPTRRQALKTAASFMILPAGLARGYAANEKLNLGIIGLTGMGGVDAKTFSGLGENIAALCDVDSTILDKRGAEYPGAAKYTDFRKMIEKAKGIIMSRRNLTEAEAFRFLQRESQDRRIAMSKLAETIVHANELI